jgi:hypothetical protein
MLSKSWLFQAGLSVGCDAALWTKDAQPTGNTCLAYYFHGGGDNIYTCANSINQNNHAYNNLGAYYITWYHKFNKRWHTDTKSWYQYERDTPNVDNPAGRKLLENGLTGQYAVEPTRSPATRRSGRSSTMWWTSSIPRITSPFARNSSDDLVDQRTGFKTRYSEH